MKRRRRPHRRQGFTLLEVLLVMMILVILVGTSTVFYRRAAEDRVRTGGEDRDRALEGFMENYAIDVGTFPKTQEGLAALMNPPAGLSQPDRWQGPYTRKEIPPDPWGNPYQYELLNADQIRIWSFGPDGQDTSGDEIENT